MEDKHVELLVGMALIGAITLTALLLGYNHKTMALGIGAICLIIDPKTVLKVLRLKK